MITQHQTVKEPWKGLRPLLRCLHFLLVSHAFRTPPTTMFGRGSIILPHPPYVYIHEWPKVMSRGDIFVLKETHTLPNLWEYYAACWSLSRFMASLQKKTWTHVDTKDTINQKSPFSFTNQRHSKTVLGSTIVSFKAITNRIKDVRYSEWPPPVGTCLVWRMRASRCVYSCHHTCTGPSGYILSTTLISSGLSLTSEEISAWEGS